MPRRMDAEIVVEANVADAMIALLTEYGLELEVIDWIGEGNTTIIAAQFTELDADAFFDEIRRLTDPFDATMMGAGDVIRPSPVIGRPGVFRRVALPLC